jgi:hypothetical protein
LRHGKTQADAIREYGVKKADFDECYQRTVVLERLSGRAARS